MKAGNSISLKPWIIALIIFLMGLLTRAPGLSSFVTTDEILWVKRSYDFAAGLLFADHECSPVEYGRQFTTTGWACTFQIGYPGVTTMWGGGLGLLLYFFQLADPANIALRTFFDTVPVDPPDPTLVAYMRLPLVILNSLFLSLFYLLLRRLISARVALVASLLLALSPFHIALSRVLHHDALVTTFMVLSLLAMVGYWLQGWRWYWLMLSALIAGLAFLTKSVSWFMMPCATIVGTLSLYYRWRQGLWRGWPEIARWVRAGLLWGAVAWAVFAAFFPAMWVIPTATVAGLISANFELGLEGHKNGHFFLGQIMLDPGPLFYPIGWLLRASPLEIVGLLAFPFSFWRISNPLVSSKQAASKDPETSFAPGSAAFPGKQFYQQPILIALLLFVLFFLIFETVSSKKMERYFLPAFAVIDIFAAIGLLWLVDKSGHAKIWKIFRLPLQSWATPALIGIIVVWQGWLVYQHAPYYFTYYNPLLGGPKHAARLITIYGWGEGIDQVAAYLNQQPEAKSLRVRSWYPDALRPFFAGEVSDFSIRAGRVLSADYLVYYQNQLQRDLQKNMEVWHYFKDHYAPVHRITLHNLDYALIYRNPIEHHLDWTKNGLSDILSIFGYNLSPNGNLTLFWQNLGVDQTQKLWAGLALPETEAINWLVCAPGADFAAELNNPKAIIESICPLATSGASTGLYDLQLALNDGQAITPVEFPAGRLAVAIDETGKFVVPDQNAGLAQILEQALPEGVTPLEVNFGNMIRLVGYRIEPKSWKPGQTEKFSLYWQPLQKPDLALAQAFELLVQLSVNDPPELILAAAEPAFPDITTTQGLKSGTVIPIQYPVSVPKKLSSGEYMLEICLVVATNGQPLMGTMAQTSEPVTCVPLPITISRL